MILGLPDADKPVRTERDVVDLVHSYLSEPDRYAPLPEFQGLEPEFKNTTFIAQKGVLFEERTGKAGRAGGKKGMQVVIFDEARGSEPVFLKTVKGLAQLLADAVAPETVMLDYEKNGLTKGLWRVTPLTKSIG